MAPDYVFRPVSVSDLSTIRSWLETPEVMRWWGAPDEQYALVSGDRDLLVLAGQTKFRIETPEEYRRRILEA